MKATTNMLKDELPARIRKFQEDVENVKKKAEVNSTDYKFSSATQYTINSKRMSPALKRIAYSSKLVDLIGDQLDANQPQNNAGTALHEYKTLET